MVVKEYLSWILDRPHQEIEDLLSKWSGDAYLKHYGDYREEKIRRNIEFVHSLGLKCDCVGWSRLDLTRPDAGEILDKIESFCKEEGWLARGTCSRWYEDFESDWYELELPIQKEVESHIDDREIDGFVYAIRAYKNKSQPILFGWHEQIPLVVSAKFRDACVKHNISDVKFCWIRDVGRYASEQYFFMYPQQYPPRIGCDYGLVYSDKYTPYRSAEGSEFRRTPALHLPHHPGSQIHERLTKIGGLLPRISEIFYDMRFSLQDCYPAKAMPERGFAYVKHKSAPYWFRDKVLIHKETAQLLIQEKVLSKKNLHPALLYEELPPGYVEMEMEPISLPREGHFIRMQSEYEALIKVPRPVRKTHTKEAVSLLRRAKTSRKPDFKKRMPKEAGAALENTAFAPLIPYYLVADGGYLSDEYRLLSCAEAQTAAADFSADMAMEELLDQPFEGIVFACCADGDRVVLRPEGTVVRVSHEIPEIVEDWPTLAQFFADCVEPEE